MRRPRNAASAVIGLLLLSLMSSSNVLALTPPNPPDRGASANNQSGQLQSPARPFSGGVLLVKDGSSNETTDTNQTLATYLCTDETNTVAKQYDPEIGESITGPISGNQTAGIIQAMASVMPQGGVVLSSEVKGLPG